MALSQATRDMIRAANERQDAELAAIQAALAATGALPGCLHLGHCIYYLIGTDKAGTGLYEYRNWRMGGRSYATLSPAGALTRNHAAKPLGFRKPRQEAR